MSNTTQSQNLFSSDEIFPTLTLKDFQIYLLTIVTMLDITSPDLFWPPSPILPILYPILLTTTKMFFLSMRLFFNCMYKLDNTVFVFLWLDSINVTPSRSIWVVINGKTSLFYGRRIFHCTFKKFCLFLVVLAPCCCAWTFPSCSEWGLLFTAVHRFLICGGFSGWGAQALDAWDSIAAAHGLSSCGTRA